MSIQYISPTNCPAVIRLVMASASQETGDEETEETGPIEVAINAGARGCSATQCPSGLPRGFSHAEIQRRKEAVTFYFFTIISCYVEIQSFICI